MVERRREEEEKFVFKVLLALVERETSPRVVEAITLFDGIMMPIGYDVNERMRR
jgi:hypothetical protein